MVKLINDKNEVENINNLITVTLNWIEDTPNAHSSDYSIK
jgi:hypothetical protein